ncbi:MAG: EVE domain-containing protein [Gammaproteobacteria bacterium]|nr:EVE domain-containing protein [Gammaproteobacteria bacterium]
MKYWLFKSEPDAYSIDDLKNEENGVGRWDGIRNYQARNLLRDKTSVGDAIIFYHSSCKNVGVAGYAEVLSAPYPDPLQFDPESKYYDPKSSAENPRWVCVDVKYTKHVSRFLPLSEIKQCDELNEMVLVNRSRLSIQPVKETEWLKIKELTKNS